MKKIILIGILTTNIALAGTAQAQYIDPVMENKLVRVCEAIQSNSKFKLRNAIKNSRVDVKRLNKGLVCNGYDPVTFAIVSNAENTGKYMASKSNVDYDALLAKL